MIWESLGERLIPPPTSEIWRKSENDFCTRWNFPNCIAAMDGKHIVIEAPPNSGSLFFNYKKTSSVVLLALVDANYRFLAVYVGAYGKNSDGGIFASSRIGKSFANNTLHIPTDKALPGTDTFLPHVIVGDEAFPLTKHLMRPYPRTRNDHQRKIFNYRLSRARRVSENAFGLLTQRFQIYQRRLKMHPHNADTVILETCCLHNFLTTEVSAETPREDPPKQDNTAFLNLRRTGGNTTVEAVNVREQFREYFATVGSVPWQERMVTQGRRNTNINLFSIFTCYLHYVAYFSPAIILHFLITIIFVAHIVQLFIFLNKQNKCFVFCTHFCC